jgi:tRNA threonylcarbamoyladenosine biosynthesis protein TsaB
VPIATALQAAEFGAPILVGNAARILALRWPQEAPAPIRIETQAAPDIAWVAWLGAAADPGKSPARPFYLRAPDARPQASPLTRDTPPPETTSAS